MKFYLSTPELDDKIKAIQRTLRLSMNGIVSDAMKERGIIYKVNYGVSIPRLREIATTYSPNHDLAQRLWMLQIRETMILATLLQPAEQFTPELAVQWSQSFNQTEIIEQTCMNLLRHCRFAHPLSLDWINADHQWLQTAGYTLAARIYTQFNYTQSTELTQTLLRKLHTAAKPTYKAAALCLSRLCRNDKQTAAYILKATDPVLNEFSDGLACIYEEVKQEIIFLDIL